MKDNKESTLKRDSSIELLRIIVMFCIIICHFATHGGFKFDNKVIDISRLWWNFIEMGGNLGVDVFVLISGYYLINSKKRGYLFKILKLWGQIVFYSIVIYLFGYLIGLYSFSVAETITSLMLFPIVVGGLQLRILFYI